MNLFTYNVYCDALKAMVSNEECKSADMSDIDKCEPCTLEPWTELK